MTEKEDSVYKLNINHLLIEIFRSGKEDLRPRGAIFSIINLRSSIETLAKITKDEELATMYMDITAILTHLNHSFITNIFKRLLRNEIKKTLLSKNQDIVLSIVDSFEDLRFIEKDVVSGDKLMENIKNMLVILPSIDRENVVLVLSNSINNAFFKGVHEELPSMLDDFFENIIYTLEKESFEDIPKILGIEKLKWHRIDMGFP